MQSFSPIYYEYDLSDTSFESEEASDDSEDSNYRPVGNNTKLKKRKVGLCCIFQTHYSPIIYSKRGLKTERLQKKSRNITFFK